MVQFLYSRDIIIYIFAGLCGLGLIIRFILDLVYKYLVKESDNLGATKNKTLRHMKMKFETCYKLKIGVNNVDTFVDKSVLRYRFCGILLSTWENVCGQILLLSFLIIPVCTVFGVIYKCGQDLLLKTGAVGISAGAILILVDKMMNLSSKKQILRVNIMDYLENFCKVRLEQENMNPSLLEQYRQEYFKAAEVSKQIKSAAIQAKEEARDELKRRREARHIKEEEKRAQALRREEEQKRVEQARKLEEQQRVEERKRLAAKRREDELLKLEEERAALEQRRSEMKKKSEEKQQMNVKKQMEAEEKDKLIHSIEEDLAAPASKKKEDMANLLNGIDEIAAEKERTQKESKEKPSGSKPKGKNMANQEEKLIEDVLKEFFA